MKFTANEIASIINGEIVGEKNIFINSVAKIEDGKKGDLCFLANSKYTHHIYNTKASIVIVNKTFKTEKPLKTTLIKVNDAYTSFSKLLEIFDKIKHDKVGVSKNSEISKNTNIGKNIFVGSFTTISDNVQLGDNVKIYPNCYIGENVKIGDNTIIFPNVSVYHNCIIGKKNIIHSGAVIGADGFGFAPKENKDYQKIKQIGNVIIGNNVEIGSNTTIDRATMGSTIISDGVKLDNLIQIAHNVTIGENTVIAAQAGVAGSTKIGKRCMVGGQTAISGHLTIADDVKIAGQSGVATNITEAGKIVQGPMAYNIKDFQRSYIIFKKLPELYKLILSKKN